MNEAMIEEKMKELAKLIDYKYNDITWLCKAMGSIKIEVEDSGKNHKEYTNESLATVGDAILDTIVAEKIYSNKEGHVSKGEITTFRSQRVKNPVLVDIVKKEGIFHYGYNTSYFYDEAPQENQVVFKKHDIYLEAIIGAIFFDTNYDYVRDWTNRWLLPKTGFFNE